MPQPLLMLTLIGFLSTFPLRASILFWCVSTHRSLCLPQHNGVPSAANTSIHPRCWPPQPQCAQSQATSSTPTSCASMRCSCCHSLDSLRSRECSFRGCFLLTLGYGGGGGALLLFTRAMVAAVAILISPSAHDRYSCSCCRRCCYSCSCCCRCCVLVAAPVTVASCLFGCLFAVLLLLL